MGGVNTYEVFIEYGELNCQLRLQKGDPVQVILNKVFISTGKWFDKKDIHIIKPDGRDMGEIPDVKYIRDVFDCDYWSIRVMCEPETKNKEQEKKSLYRMDDETYRKRQDNAINFLRARESKSEEHLVQSKETIEIIKKSEIYVGMKGYVIDQYKTYEVTVKYLGEMKSRTGVWAGVELLPDANHPGMGTGVVEGIRYFMSYEGRGVFVPLGTIYKEIPEDFVGTILGKLKKI